MILLGDCLNQMKTLAENSVDSIVTDPPYGLAFIGCEMDPTYFAIAERRISSASAPLAQGQLLDSRESLHDHGKCDKELKDWKQHGS